MKNEFWGYCMKLNTRVRNRFEFEAYLYSIPIESYTADYM